MLSRSSATSSVPRTDDDSFSLLTGRAIRYHSWWCTHPMTSSCLNVLSGSGFAALSTVITSHAHAATDFEAVPEDGAGLSGTAMLA
jgi:hypothetical protein